MREKKIGADNFALKVDQRNFISELIAEIYIIDTMLKSIRNFLAVFEAYKDRIRIESMRHRYGALALIISDAEKNKGYQDNHAQREKCFLTHNFYLAI